ncbi:hypothetical protein GMMP15_1550005 [Candidatus Magnetomoraceae bacterium gMMP-15]
MPVYNYAEVCNHLSRLLDEAKKIKEVIIKSKTGELFVVKAVPKKGATYNLPNFDLN